MKLSNPVKLNKDLEIKSIDVRHKAEIKGSTYQYVLDEDAEQYVDCHDIVSMTIGGDVSDIVFECDCKRLDPIALHEFLLRDLSKLDIISFCFEFLYKFSGRSVDSLEISTDKLYYVDDVVWKSIKLDIPIRSAEISRVCFSYIRGWIDTVQIHFTDGDAIFFGIDLDKCVGKGKDQGDPINFFRYLEMIMSCINPRNNVGKEELFRRIVFKLRYALKVVRLPSMYFVDACFLRAKDKISIFYNKISIDWGATTFKPMYVKGVDLNIGDLKYEDMKYYPDKDMEIIL